MLHRVGRSLAQYRLPIDQHDGRFFLPELTYATAAEYVALVMMQFISASYCDLRLRAALWANKARAGPVSGSGKYRVPDTQLGILTNRSSTHTVSFASQDLAR